MILSRILSQQRATILLTLTTFVCVSCSPVLFSIPKNSIDSSSDTEDTEINSPSESIPTLAYLPGTGIGGFVGQALQIIPSTLNSGSNGGTSVTNCQIKPGSINASLFPSDLVINPLSCEISGTPTASLSETNFTILATNAAGVSTEATLKLSVSACNPTLTASFGSGNGTSASPYLICNSSQLNKVGDTSTVGSVLYYKLEKDLDLTSASLNPIGSLTFPFRGIFDGNNHTLSNWTYGNLSTNYVGLFGYVSGSSIIKNLNLSEFHLTARSLVGAAVGFMNSNSSMTNVKSSGSITAAVNGYQSYAGGLVGQINLTSSSNSVSITHSSSTSSVSGQGYDVGGLIGAAIVSNTASSASVSVSTSFATGDVMTSGGLTRTGGLIGEIFVNHSSGSVIITNCYARGSVIDTSGSSVGGLYGRTGNTGTRSIANCYATGAVNSSNYGTGSGGMSAVSSIYWDTQSSGTVAGSGTGKTTSQMQDLSTYVGWDFVNTWYPPSLEFHIRH